MVARILPAAPALPLAAQVYDPRNIEQLTRVLRLYFTQLDGFNSTTYTWLDETMAEAGAAEQKAVEALAEVEELREDIRNQLKYGYFYDTTDQTAAVANTAYAITFNTTDLAGGVYLGSPTSRVYAPRNSIYNIQFSAQLLSNAGGTHQVWVWLRKNGTNVANSTTKVTVEGNNTAVVAAWNFLLPMSQGDYFELMWESDDTHVFLNYETGSAVHPAIPSIILSVTDNFSDSYV